MLEYYPWSQDVLNECMLEYKKGKFSVLDIDLGGECNFTCIYCDSPDRKVLCSVSVLMIERFLESHHFKWIHICGIGEPTFAHNYELLIKILDLCEKYNVKCNMFSNVYNLTDELKEYVKKEILYILFKVDTLSNTYASNLYGINSGMAQKQIENIKKLAKLVKIRDGCTNLAASIVPTNINWPIIIPLIKNMYENNIFPMVGDLENSGRGKDHFEALNLNEKRLIQLKHDISDIVGANYIVPQCPAVISSIHINTDNEVVVDEYTGLSCNWFWLKEPKLKTLITLNENIDIHEVTDILMQYRLSRVSEIKLWLEQNQNCYATFGGCGGDIVLLLKAYLEVQGGIL